VTRDEAAAALAWMGTEMVRRGLTWGTSGNLSARTDPERFLISATGTRLDDLGPGRLATCCVAGPDPAGDGPRPSSEVAMHRAVYAAVPDAAVISHSSAPCTTLVACSRMQVPVEVNTDALAFCGPVVRVPYRHPGSADLARATAAHAPRARALLLSNHGSLVWGATPDEVLRRTEALEFIARLLVTARSAGVPLTRIRPDDVATFPYG
jgi:ribulose-5-phosphate 4-epimerase/fuculose-1-phosphate aldolase